MKKNTKIINFGVARNQILKYVSENKNKHLVMEFVNMVKSNPIFKAQNTIFSNLETKQNLTNEDATRYIDTNIMIIKKFSKENLQKENEILKKFIIDESNLTVLQKNIHSLIVESLKTIPNVNKMHDSFGVIYESVTKKTEVNEYEEIYKAITKEVDFDVFLETFIRKFKEKYKDFDYIDNRIIETYTYEKPIDDIYSEIKEKICVFLRNKIQETKNLEEKVKIYETLDKINENKNIDLEHLLQINELRKNLLN